MVDLTSRQLESDQAQEVQMQTVARIEYQRPALSLSEILQAPNLDQLISSVAQARLVASKEEALHNQARALRERDAAARSQAWTQLAKMSADRNRAAQVVHQTQATLQAVQSQAAQSQAAQAVQSQAQVVNQPAETAAAAPGSIQQINLNAFAPRLRIAKCESTYNRTPSTQAVPKAASSSCSRCSRTRRWGVRISRVKTGR